MTAAAVRAGWTRHGYAITGVAQHGEPTSRARCGGPGVCNQCSRDAALAQQRPTKGIDALIPPEPLSVDDVLKVGLKALVIQARSAYDTLPDDRLRGLLEDVIADLDLYAECGQCGQLLARHKGGGCP